MPREHWVEAPLSQLLESLESGSRPKGGVKGITEGVPSIGAEHLAADGGFNFENIRFVPDKFANSMNRGQIRHFDILVVKDGATTGKTSFVRETFPFPKSCVNEHVFICRAFKIVSKEFLFHYLKSHEGQEYIMSTFHGAAQGGISSGFADVVIVPLPPLPEQKRIVEKLDSILPKVKSIKARLEKIPRILKHFRQSIFASACSGKLTEDWREVASASLIDQECPLNGVETSEDLPEGWRNKILYDLTKKVKRGPSMKCNQEGIGIRYITSGNLEDGKLRLDYDYKFLSGFSETERCQLKPNDLILNCVNSLDKIGKTAVFNESDGLAIIGFNNYALEINIELSLPKYLNIYCQSHIFQGQLRSIVKHAVNQVSFATDELKQLLISLPPIPEQREIIRRVEKLFKLADSLEAKYKKAMQRVQKIEQSVLAKAFRGELAPQDPNDEPAEELLKRILAEKSKLSGQGNKRKR